MRQNVSATRRPSVKITGWVREIAATHLLVGDHKLCIDPASTIADDARVGVYAVAKAWLDEQGQLHAEDVAVLPLPEQARGVSVQPPGDLPGYAFEFRGVIQEIQPRYWIVGNRLVFITDRTVIRGRPEVDALAEVKGMLLFENIVLAKTIKVTMPGAYAEVEFEGIIESMSEDSWVVNGVTVMISPVTVIQGTPAFGLVAEVQGVLQPDSTVLAEQITVRDPDFMPHIDIEGIVESIEATQWVVAGTTVLIDGNTFIDESRAPAEVGVWAQVRALSQRDGSLLALRILLSRPD